MEKMVTLGRTPVLDFDGKTIISYDYFVRIEGETTVYYKSKEAAEAVFELLTKSS